MLLGSTLLGLQYRRARVVPALVAWSLILAGPAGVLFSIWHIPSGTMLLFCCAWVIVGYLLFVGRVAASTSHHPGSANYRQDEEREPVWGQGPHKAGTTDAMGAPDERLWSILAHVSVIIAPVGALIIWLVYKDRSERVRFHALQALWYQVAWFGIFVAYFLVATILSIVTLGIAAVILFPLMMFLPFAPVVHGCYAAYKVSLGEDYRYPFVADRIDGGTHRVA